MSSLRAVSAAAVASMSGGGSCSISVSSPPDIDDAIRRSVSVSCAGVRTANRAAKADWESRALGAGGSVVRRGRLASARVGTTAAADATGADAPDCGRVAVAGARRSRRDGAPPPAIAADVPALTPDAVGGIRGWSEVEGAFRPDGLLDDRAAELRVPARLPEPAGGEDDRPCPPVVDRPRTEAAVAVATL